MKWYKEQNRWVDDLDGCGGKRTLLESKRLLWLCHFQTGPHLQFPSYFPSLMLTLANWLSAVQI